MHNMLIVALMVFGFIMINPFIYGSDASKMAATEESSVDENGDDLAADDSEDEEETEDEEDSANN